MQKEFFTRDAQHSIPHQALVTAIDPLTLWIILAETPEGTQILWTHLPGILDLDRMDAGFAVIHIESQYGEIIAFLQFFQAASLSAQTLSRMTFMPDSNPEKLNTIKVILPSGSQETRSLGGVAPALFIKELYETDCRWVVDYSAVPVGEWNKWLAADTLWTVFRTLRHGRSVYFDKDTFRVTSPPQIQEVRELCHEVIDRLIELGFVWRLAEDFEGDLFIKINYLIWD